MMYSMGGTYGVYSMVRTVWRVQYGVYSTNCDGDCIDRPYVNGKRTASTLVYCTVADKGGATSFTKVLVHCICTVLLVMRY
jgi:hypothetical protein